MTWNRGKARVEQLLRDGELGTVPVSEPLARRLLDEAGRHLASATAIAETDPTGCYQLAYDAARKACSALLARQGRGLPPGAATSPSRTPSGSSSAGPAGSRRSTRYPACDDVEQPANTPTPPAPRSRPTMPTHAIASAQQLLDTDRLDTFQPD